MWTRVLRLLGALCLSAALCTAAAAADLDRARIGLTRSASSSSMYVAAAKGYFASEGLDAQLVFFDSDVLVSAAVASGKVDFGVTMLTASSFSYFALHEIKMIASQAGDQAGYPGNALVITKKSYEVGKHGWKDFLGKRVGIPSVGSGLHYAFVAMASKYGFDPRELRFVWTQTADKQVAALTRGQIDMAIVPAAIALQFRASGEGNIIRWVGDEMPWQEGVVVTRARTIREERPLVEKFIRAYQRASADYDQTFLQHDDGADVIKGEHFDEYLELIAQHTSTPVDRLAHQLPWTDHLARLNVADIQDQLVFWQNLGLVNKSISAADLVDLSLMSEHIGALH